MIKPGDAFPHLVFPDLDGDSLDTRELIGNPLLVFFWGSW